MSPKSQEKKFPRNYAKELYRIAQGDLDSARTLSKSKTGRPENACFHAHQSVEKALKALLVALSQPVPLVHDLGILVAKIPSNRNPPFGYELSSLNDYSTVRRYEEGKMILEQTEIEKIVSIATEVITWVGPIVGRTD
nr:HEPN domain protein [uncultured bacterium]AIA17942.1 HEPN domain protein [uncultured bacterium]